MRDDLDYILRYGLLLGIGISALAPLYWFLTPITVGSSNLILSLFGRTILLTETTIVFKGLYLSLVPACIAGAAYYLLLICACAIPLSWSKRGKIIALSCSLFFVFNLIRILFATYLATNNQSLFNITHAFFWYAGSTIMVIVCWFGTAVYYNVKEVPVLTDVQNLIKAIRGKR